MKKTLVYLLTCAVFLCSGNIIVTAHRLEDEHSELFKTVVVKDGMDLNIVECVALAFKNSPKIKRKKYELDIAKSNVGIARSAFFPVISSGVGYYNENNSNPKVGSRYRELPNVGLAVNQLVWDFGKSTAYIKMEEFYKIGAEYEFMDSLCLTLFDVKRKYYNVLQAQANANIAEQNVEICRKYMQIAKGKPDKEIASFYLSKALIEANYAQTLLKNAKVMLSNAMFIDNTANYNIINTASFNYNNDYGYNNGTIPSKFIPYEFDFPRSEAVNIAYASSPDLRVLESTKGAMEQALKYVKRTYFPKLTAGVGYGYRNTNELSNNSLNVGVNLSSNVNLMELKHSIKGADAQLSLADNEINLLKKDLYYEIQEAFNNLDYVSEDIPYTQETVKKSLNNIKLVEKLYLSGELNYIALQDARKDYITALQSYVNSLTFYNKSLIQVEEALHYHLVDIHHRSKHAMISHSDELIEHLNVALGCDKHDKNIKRFGGKKKKHTEDL